MNQKVGVPLRSRHFLSQKLWHFHNNTSSYVENESCCPHTVNISNVNFTLKKIHICILYNSSMLRWHRQLKSYLVGDNDLFIRHGQYHSHWWPCHQQPWYGSDYPKLVLFSASNQVSHALQSPLSVFIWTSYKRTSVISLKWQATNSVIIT